MPYTALYRKFRPRVFEDVKGQDAIVTTLKNQIKNERTSHAYLFCGTRGTGKTTIAKILARAVNCENPQDGSPCGECAVCRGIQDGSLLNVIEIDAASNNGVDNVRQIIDEVSYSPTAGKFKVYIIDEVHMLSAGAFNALLKTLEEPPEYVIFILATTEPHKLPITILSRCQRYDFRRISVEEIAERLKELTGVEQVMIEEKALTYIAKTADGSMRDALSLLDQCIAFHFGQKLTYDKVLDVLGAVDTEVFSRILRAVLEQNVVETLKILDEVVYRGRELGQFITDLTWYLRNMLLLKTAPGSEEIIDLSSENMARMSEEAEKISFDVIIRYIRILSELAGQIKYASQKRILVEVALIKLCRPQMETDKNSMIDRIRVLEDKMERGIVVNATASSGGYSDNSLVATAAVSKASMQLDKALPDDIKNAVSKWSIIVADCDEVFKQYLSDAYPSIEGEDILVVVFRTDYGYNRFAVPERMEELRQAISEIIGADIKLSVRREGDGGASGDLYPDIRAFVEEVNESIDFEIDDIGEDDFDDEEDYEDIERDEDNG